MIFIAGPRQSGKTTFAKSLIPLFKSHLYFNWDIATDRKTLRSDPYFYEALDHPPGEVPILIFDEIHKYRNWKNYLKGVFDRDQGRYKIIVTGSGRLDAFSNGGDSLAGRYFLMHIWPFTIVELYDGKQKSMASFLSNPLDLADNINDPILHETWEKLSTLSGFPTPYLANSEPIYRVWSDTYNNQLLREDIRNLSGIIKIDQLEELLELLPAHVGSTISLNNLAENIGVSFDSVKSWLETFDRFYLTFRIAPFSSKISRTLTKEKKLYFFNYAQISDLAARFENMVALELLRATTSWNERGHGRFSLNYIRTKDKEECDFLICRDKKPLLLLECKYADKNISKTLLKFGELPVSMSSQRAFSSL